MTVFISLKSFFVVVISLSICLGVTAQELRDMSGEIIAEGKNKVPVDGGEFKVTSYRIEDLTTKSTDKKPNKVGPFRLAITGEFQTGPYIIAINGVEFLAVRKKENEIHLNFFDTLGTMFEENAEIIVSLRDSKIQLPERFSVPSYLRTSARSGEELRSNISLAFVDCDGSRLQKRLGDCVFVGIKKNPFLPQDQFMNHSWYIQIGEKEFLSGPGGVAINLQDFEKLKNGDWVIIKPGQGLVGGYSVGRLDKSLIR